MGWAKYFEDNMEIIYERLTNLQVRTSETEIKIVCSNIQPTAKIVIEIKPETTDPFRQEEYCDRYIMCRDCGRKFLFTAKAQKHYDKMRWDDPKRCSHCREHRNTRYLMCSSF